MIQTLRQILNDAHGPLRPQLLAILGTLAAANAGVWVLAIIVLHAHPLLLGTAAIAYGFGLRHAVDADHIAAIDNVTRKLMQEGKKPLLVGFWFSLGHSTIVVCLSLLVAVTTVAIQDRFPAWKEIGGVIGTSVSALFLLLIAVFNLIVLRDLMRAFAVVRLGGVAKANIFGHAHAHPHDHRHSILLAHDHDHAHGHDQPLQGGLIARILRPLFRLISRSWHMFPLGVLFGLGFDTATEVGLLGISAAQATQGLPIWSILIFPALFTAGMSLVDTADGILMQSAYGWAYLKPMRKLYYNMTITALSVVIALLVGGIEALGLIGDKFGLTGTFWDAIGSLGDHFGLIGYGIIGIFVLGWGISALVYHLNGYDEIGAEAPPEA